MDPILIHIASIAVGGYLLGSIPFGYILVKLFLKQDIRATGSGNIGATNVARSGKKGLAVATLLLDAGKGASAALVTMLLTPDDGRIPFYVAIAALGSILGHCFPVWLKFRGGKGVATAVGALGVLSPRSLFIALLCFAIILAFTRYVSLSSILSAVVFPVAFNHFESGPYFFFVVLTPVTVSSIIIILKHHANIRRLIAGTEPKFGAKAMASTDPIQREKSI